LILFALLVDLEQIVFKADLNLLCIFLNGVNKGLSRSGLHGINYFFFGSVDLSFAVEISLVADNLCGSEGEDISVLFPCFEDRQ
jgi:hypothetical protein